MKYILFFYVIGIFLLPVVLATDVGIGITPSMPPAIIINRKAILKKAEINFIITILLLSC